MFRIRIVNIRIRIQPFSKVRIRILKITNDLRLIFSSNTKRFNLKKYIIPKRTKYFQKQDYLKELTRMNRYLIFRNILLIKFGHFHVVINGRIRILRVNKYRIRNTVCSFLYFFHKNHRESNWKVGKGTYDN